jgi:hypothetical protein
MEEEVDEEAQPEPIDTTARNMTFGDRSENESEDQKAVDEEEIDPAVYEYLSKVQDGIETAVKIQFDSCRLVVD